MHKILLNICNFISTCWNSKWRYLLIFVFVLFFFFTWTLLLNAMPQDGEYSEYTEYLAFGYILIPFYALSIWHVVSEDERELSLLIKIRQSLFISFNKLLFAILFFLLYLVVLGTISGEL